jgi:O-antigen/teichoic acid export membrane protein
MYRQFVEPAEAETREIGSYVSRRLHVDVGWLWVGYLARSLSYLALTAVLARSLGPSGYGELSLFLALTLGVSQVAGSWPFLAVPVLGAESKSVAAAFRPAAIVASLATLAALVVALPLAVLIMSDSPVSLLALVLYSVALVGLQGAYGVLQTEGRMRGIASLQTMERLTGLVVLLIAAAVATLTVRTSEGLLAFAAVATCLAAFVFMTPEALRGSTDDSPDHLVSTVMKAVGAMGIVSVCAYGVAWADIYVLNAFRSHEDVGIYSLAYQVFTFVVQLGSMWAVAALPRHARSEVAGEDLLSQLPMDRTLTVTRLWSAVVPALAVVSIFALPKVFGTDFEQAAVPMTILLSGAIYLAGYFAVLPTFVAGRRTRLLAKVSIASVAINIGLDFALVPALGFNGPAIATAAQTVFGAAALLWFALGASRASAVMLAGTPAAIALAVLAASPHNVALIALTIVVAAMSFVWGASGLRGLGVFAEPAGSEP